MGDMIVGCCWPMIGPDGLKNSLSFTRNLYLLLGLAEVGFTHLRFDVDTRSLPSHRARVFEVLEHAGLKPWPIVVLGQRSRPFPQCYRSRLPAADLQDVYDVAFELADRGAEFLEIGNEPAKLDVARYVDYVEVLSSLDARIVVAADGINYQTGDMGWAGKVASQMGTNIIPHWSAIHPYPHLANGKPKHVSRMDEYEWQRQRLGSLAVTEMAIPGNPEKLMDDMDIAAHVGVRAYFLYAYVHPTMGVLNEDGSDTPLATMLRRRLT